MKQFKYKVKIVRYKVLKDYEKILTAFSNTGWEFVETKERDFYKPLEYHKDKILFKKPVE